MDKKNELHSPPSTWLPCYTKQYQCHDSTKLNRLPLTESELWLPENKHDVSKERKPAGGWKAMPFILGYQAFENLASIMLLANLMMFLLTKFHMDPVLASNVLNIWSGITNFAPLVGAYLADAHLGRFRIWERALLYGTDFLSYSIPGMLTLTLVAWLPQLHPPLCDLQTQTQCSGPSTFQSVILSIGLGLLAIGACGIRPCTVAFGVDQFDSSTVEGKKGIARFFNWSYVLYTTVMLIGLVGVIFQDKISWTIRFGLPTVLLFWGMVLYFAGTRTNIFIKPERTVFGETKGLIKVIPIWISGIINCIAMSQKETVSVSQALKMDCHMGPNFQISSGTIFIFSMITIMIWLPIYDGILVPVIRKVTKIEDGITLLQKMGFGIILTTLSMIVAGVVELMRKNSDMPISVFWLAPQMVLIGFAESFNIVGQIEFYNKEFPENLRSIAYWWFDCTMATTDYVGTMVVNVVHTTGRNGHPDWLSDDIDKGKLENFYFLIAGICVLNLLYFVWVSPGYRYKKSQVQIV